MEREQTVVPRCEGYLFDCFEASLKLGTILQKGERLKVQRLPFKMLVALLEKPGEVVTKEELARELWDQQVIGDTDQSLYVMARKLRQLLGDDVDQPRFIQTVSGQGYTFIGSVTPIFTPPATVSLPLLPPPSNQSGGRDSVPSRDAVRTSGGRAIRKTMWAGVTIAAALCAGVGIYIYRYEHRVLMTDQDKVVVGAFTNSTGSPDFDQTLSAVIQSQLQESPYLDLIPDQRFLAAIKKPETASLQEELRACATLDGQVLLKGGISALAQGYQVSLTAWRCAGGRLLTTQTADAASQSAILAALDLATERMRRRLGEPEDSLKKFNVPAAQATTASLAALKAFNFGTEKRMSGDLSSAIASYKLAIDLDPQFALAYASLGTIYHNTEQFAVGAEFTKRAFELRSSRASDRERLYIITHYYQFVTGQTQRAIEVYELWRTLYPRDVIPINNLAAQYLLFGQPQRALPLVRQAIQLDPTNEENYALLGEAYLKMGDYAKVKALCDDQVHEKMDMMSFHRVCFESAFVQGDQPAMEGFLQWAHGNTEEGEAFAYSAWVAVYRGRISDAKILFRQAERIALQSKSTELAADIALDQAMLEAEVGLFPAARADARKVLKLPFESALEQAYAARALARAGDKSLALTVAKKAESMAPLNDLIGATMLPTVRGAVYLQEADPADALKALEESRQFDLCTCMELAPGYYRGLAYLQNKQPELAVREFQQVIDHRFLSTTFSVYLVLSQLELGHAYQLLGDSRSANSAFTKVELAWKDADPSFPPLQTLRQYKELLPISEQR